MHLSRLTTLLVAASSATVLAAAVAAPATAGPPPKSPYAYTVSDFPSPAEAFSRLAIDPEYDTLYISDYQRTGVSLVDTTTGAVRTTVPVGGAQITVDTATHVAYTHRYGTDALTAIDRSGSTRAVPGMGSTSIYALAADPTTHEIYGTDVGHDAVNVVAAAGGRVATIPVGDTPWDIAIDDVGRRAYVLDNQASSMSVIDLDTHAVVATVGVGELPYAVAVDTVTHRVYVGYYLSDDVTVVDGGTNQVIDTISTPGGALDIAVDPVSHTAYAAAGTSVAAIDLTTDTVSASISVRSAAHDLVVDPIRHTAFTFESDNSVQQITQTVLQRAVIHGLSPTSGGTAGGEQITITGDHFAGATKVLFGTTPATSFTVESDERIVATVPAHQAGTVPVRVKTRGLSAPARTSRYTYVTPAG